MWLENAGFLTLSFWLYETVGFSPGTCSCQKLPTACSPSASAMPGHGPTWLNKASLHRSMLPAVLKARPLGKTSARVFTSWCQQRKRVPGKTKVCDACLPVALFCMDFLVSVRSPSSSQPFLLTNFPGNFEPSSSLSGCTWNRFKSCWRNGGRRADRRLNVLFLVLLFLGSFCVSTKGHRDSQESQLKVPFQLPRALFPFITHSRTQTCS